ncbi:DUF2254 domain-containing protein [Gayadomonas joobiniege]|uniref:DUF2254 domain-containing protein n=1 Tax=Gayadomonas joobiniege TaxID=1234606 RepID=UPI000363D124|nr:DUF2254 domain-containing protein [Gayadomonas joobiniege]
MSIRLLNLWYALKSSFWFLPSLLVLAALLTAIFLPVAERNNAFFQSINHGLPALLSYGVDGARSVLSTIAGAMITVTGIAFSITIVSLTLASSQFGPRLLRNFMQDRGNQLVLGCFLSTYVYCLLVLSRIYESADYAFVPNLSVTLAIIFALFNVGVLVYFIHHIATNIQADRVIESVHHELNKNIHQFFPEKGEKAETVFYRPCQAMYAIDQPKSGYVQAIDYQALIKLALDTGTIIEVVPKPGDFVSQGQDIFYFGCGKPLEHLPKRVIKQAQKAIITGGQRTSEQDGEFAVRQLVEIALRALSPGINDPYTAMTCLDRLTAAMCLLANKQPMSTQLTAQQPKRLCVVRPVLSYSDILLASYEQIIQAGANHYAVSLHILTCIQQLAVKVEQSDAQRTLEQLIDLVLSLTSKADFSEGQKQQLKQLYYQSKHQLMFR